MYKSIVHIVKLFFTFYLPILGLLIYQALSKSMQHGEVQRTLDQVNGPAQDVPFGYTLVHSYLPPALVLAYLLMLVWFWYDYVEK